jgi:hypothetical protein
MASGRCWAGWNGWDRRQWPTPVFVRYEELTGRSLRIFYDDDDPNRVLREKQVAPGEAEQAPKDGLMGAGFAEGRCPGCWLDTLSCP